MKMLTVFYQDRSAAPVVQPQNFLDGNNTGNQGNGVAVGGAKPA